MTAKKIVLCSASPRRKQILEKLGIEFSVRVSGCDESCDLTDPALLSVYVAEQKARAVAGQNPAADEVYIGFDTVVFFENRMLGKPADMKVATQCLRELSGNWHKVYTGVCVLDGQGADVFSTCACTEVKFRCLDENMIENYFRCVNPLDKAGAYNIEGAGGIIVESIRGCYFNVVGLPVFELSGLLSRAGIDLLERCK